MFIIRRELVRSVVTTTNENVCVLFDPCLKTRQKHVTILLVQTIDEYICLKKNFVKFIFKQFN